MAPSRRRLRSTCALVTTLLILLTLHSAHAQSTTPQEDTLRVDLSGLYTLWGLSQHNLLLGQDLPLDDADYIVQLLRVQLRAGKARYGVAARLDAAQGWWGVDNSPDNVPALNPDGSPTTTYNPYKLFGSKDTHYAIHVDHAYLYVDIPATPLRVTAGRQYFSVGNKLVLDHDHDGVIVSASDEDLGSVDLLWARISEGRDSYKAPTALLLNDHGAQDDADLLGLRALLRRDRLHLEAFTLYYTDRSQQPDYAYLPNGLGYLQARFTPQITQAWAFGIAGDAHLDLLRGLDLRFEIDYLHGEDRVDNNDHAAGLLDLNNGALRGYNLLAQASLKLNTQPLPLDLNITLGRGSGDDDIAHGRGNINKIQTMGSWDLLNVWEDSVMPDLNGISPQGLGSPVSRGYRELENTTLLLAALGAEPLETLRVELVAAWLRATRPVRGFDAQGAPTRHTAQDLGQEIDLNLRWKLYPGFTYEARLGYFIPGEAASLLITGDNTHREHPWELKQTFTATF